MRFKDENYRKEKSNPLARLDCFSLLIKYTTLPIHQPWPAPRHSHLFPVALKHLEYDSPPKKGQMLDAPTHFELPFLTQNARRIVSMGLK